MKCGLVEKECRHCSDEARRVIRDACDLKTHARVLIRKVIPLGLYCNNHIIKKSGWIEDIKVCPTEEGRNAPYVIPDVNPVVWLKKRGKV